MATRGRAWAGRLSHQNLVPFGPWTVWTQGQQPAWFPPFPWSILNSRVHGDVTTGDLLFGRELGALLALPRERSWSGTLRTDCGRKVPAEFGCPSVPWLVVAGAQRTLPVPWLTVLWPGCDGDPGVGWRELVLTEDRSLCRVPGPGARSRTLAVCVAPL